MLRIVSGGQTGVDRGALSGALQGGLACGGWCPAGRRAEDGPIPEQFPLRELEDRDYAARTRRNVADSDATVILAFGEPGGGTALTARCARALGRPLLVLDAHALTPGEACGKLMEFLADRKVRVLNVAGPRASDAPGAAAFARELVLDLARRQQRDSVGSEGRSP
jgi:hypothetical protein